MTTKPAITVTFKGPLLTGKGGPIFWKHVNNAGQDIVEAGEQRLDKVLQPRPAGVYLSVQQARGPGWRSRKSNARDPSSSGHYRRNINGEWSRGAHSGRIDDDKVQYGPWLESGKSHRRTRFKGYRQFRQTTQFMNKAKRKIIEKHVRLMMREMRGR